MPRFQVGFRRTKLHACPLYWHQPARMHAAAGSSPVRLQALPPALSSARLLGAAGDLTPTTTANTGSGLSTGALLRALCLLRIWRLLSSCGMDRSARVRCESATADRRVLSRLYRATSLDSARYRSNHRAACSITASIAPGSGKRWVALATISSAFGARI